MVEVVVVVVIVVVVVVVEVVVIVVVVVVVVVVGGGSKGEGGKEIQPFSLLIIFFSLRQYRQLLRNLPSIYYSIH